MSYFVLRRVVMICLLPILLFACTSAEEKAQAEYTRIAAIEQAGDVDQALILYDRLALDSPNTPAAQQAIAAKKRILMTRESALRLEMADQVERFRLAFDGYRSMFGKLPVSVKEFDASGYFFDSEYLAEMVPAGYTTYLLLDKNEFRLWPLRADKPIAFVGGLSGELQRVEREAATQEIAAGYQEMTRKGNLVFLARK